MADNPTEKRKNGRPTIYSDELAAEFFSRLVSSNLRTVCSGEDMPCIQTFFNWLGRHPSFLEQYRACAELRADVVFEESLVIADDSSGDYTMTEEGPALVAENIQRSKLRVDTRKWFVSKLAPKRYGERTTTELTGKDGEALVPILNLTVTPKAEG